ncbi:EamA-like transporter [Aureococcus anophagefferens]|nr:EamA-like transporter [Aureococcus anophagefferens]
MVHVLLPIVAGCVAPGLKAVGLFVWADCWAHDAVALNGFKSSLATGLFAALSLRILGAKRMIAIDATKPFVGAAFGWLFLGDAVGALGYAGVVATTAGVYLLNRAEPAEDDDEKRAALRDEEKDETRAAEEAVAAEAASSEARWRLGYALAVANVLCDVAAATITVARRRRLTSEEVNLIRFGISSALLDVFLFARHLRRPKAAAPPAMTRRAWRNVVFGVVCVTFLTPLIYTWTMFVLPLSVAITLSRSRRSARSRSAFHGERVTRGAAAGAALAVGGVACLRSR